MKDELKKTALVLRCCAADMSSYGGFVWPGVGGIAVAPDWVDDNTCGNGLHGWLYGKGDPTASDLWRNENSKWLVVEVDQAGICILGGKCKFEMGTVVFVGEKSAAAAYLIENEERAERGLVIGAKLGCADDGIVQGGPLSILTGGECATMTGGDHATMTGGDNAKMIGGNHAKMTGGDNAKMIGGDGSKMIGGNHAKMTGGDNAKMIGGNHAKMIGGYFAKMTGGNGSTMTGGNGSTMTGGNGSTMTGGECATMTGGECATMFYKYFDGRRARFVVAYVGENRIKPGVAYKLDSKNKLIEVNL